MSNSVRHKEKRKLRGKQKVKEANVNGRMAKKIRKETRRAWKLYYNSMCDLPLWNRLVFAWDIITRTKIG